MARKPTKKKTASTTKKKAARKAAPRKLATTGAGKKARPAAGKGKATKKAAPKAKRTAATSKPSRGPDKLLVARIKRKRGYIYFVDERNMNVYRFPEDVKDERDLDRRKELVLETRLKSERGWLYYVDTDGDVARTPVARGYSPV